MANRSDDSEASDAGPLVNGAVAATDSPKKVDSTEEQLQPTREQVSHDTSADGGGAGARFEAVLAQCGNAGAWQWRVLFLTSLVGTLSAFHNIGSVFLGATPDHWCHSDDTNDTESQLSSAADEAAADQRRQCEKVVPVGNGSYSYVTCDAWDFNRTQYQSTIVTEWSLVCDRRALYSTVQASFMLGKLFGYPILGALSDCFGRRKVSLVGVVAQLVVASCASFSGHYTVFITLRFFVAALTGINSTAFTLAVEASGPKIRALTGILFVIPYSLGVMMLPGVAYLVSEWRDLQLAISLPYAAVIVIVYMLPESPRWLAERGRSEEALSVLKDVARINKRQLPADEEMLKQLEECRSPQASNAGCLNKLRASFPVYLLFRGPVMRYRMLASMWVFIVTNAIYYGIQFDSAQLSRSPYLAIFLSGLVEIPANLTAGPLINRFGRRVCTAVLFLLTGGAILAILAVPAHLAWPKLLLAIIGKLFITAVYSIIYLYVIEYIPTTLRNVGLGLTTSSGRIGSVTAPYVVDLLTLYHWSLPSCVFGLAAVSGALVTLLLPETRGRRLPETVADVETRSWETVEDNEDLYLAKRA